MDNERISLKADCLEEQALQYFYHASGFNKQNEKEKLLLSEALGIGDRMKREIKVRALASSFQQAMIRGDQLRIGDVVVQSSDFHLLKEQTPPAIYAYLLTVDDVPQDEEDSVFTQYFMDIWANAYVNSGIKALEDFFRRHYLRANQRIDTAVWLKHFSPGLDNMDLQEVSKLFCLLEGSKIDVRLTAHHMMLPMKSHGGFFLVGHSTADDSAKPSGKFVKSHWEYCADCRLDNDGCRLCVHYSQRRGKI